MGNDVFILLIFAVLWNIVSMSVSTQRPCPNYGKCGISRFECLDGKCIERSRYCDGKDDCADRTDEMYCGRNYYNCSGISSRRFERCKSTDKCIPFKWKCDGIKDCHYGDDESGCDDTIKLKLSSSIPSLKSISWLKNTSSTNSATRKWGPQVHKSAVALYLSDSDFLSSDSSARKEITYELSIELLSRINQNKIQGISSGDLASFINAFLVTCTDPRNFHGHNLVEELRSRVNNQNYTAPYLLLTLCNAGDIITESDVSKLTDVFWNKKRILWADTQALALMALSCARKQASGGSDFDEEISDLAMDLKRQQARNGTVDNLYNTLLVLQALFSVEPNEDPDNFDEIKARSYVLQNQKPDGSFGNFKLTYYALPVLGCKSLADISSSHCTPLEKSEDTAMFDLINSNVPKARIRYSIWIGSEKNIERTMSLLVPSNTSFYGIMEIAAEIDQRFKFDYVVKERKPYINALSGILDDSETEQYWFPFQVKDGKASLIEESTADVRPKNGDHIAMWYKKANWME